MSALASNKPEDEGYNLAPVLTKLFFNIDKFDVSGSQFPHLLSGFNPLLVA